MILPGLNDLPRSVTGVSVFGGYQTSASAAENEFVQMKNMTADYFPCAAPRRPRRIEHDLAAAGVQTVYGMLYRDGLYTVAGLQQDADGDAYLLYQTQPVCVSEEPIRLSRTEKKMVGMGAWVVIFPDAVAYNTQDASLRRLFCFNNSTQYYCFFCDRNNQLLALTFSKEEHEKVLLEQTLDGQVTFYEYDAKAQEWKEKDDVYLRFSDRFHSGKTDFSMFEEGQTLTLTAADPEKESIEEIEALAFGESTVVTMGTEQRDTFTEHYLVMTVNSTYLSSARFVKEITDAGGLWDYELDGKTVTVFRMAPYLCNIIPEMDFVVECGNRLWGCSSAQHEIYACALGDPASWRKFEGTSMDSFAMTVGSDGDFTGAAVYGGCPIFFKENGLYKMLGLVPSQFQLVTVPCRGLAAGCAASVVVLNGALYYKGYDGIYAYDGALPQRVSQALDYEPFEQVCAAACGQKYYFCATFETGRRMMCLDTARGLFTVEDEVDARWMVSSPRQAFALVNGKVYGLCPDAGEPDTSGNESWEEPFEWSCVTGDFGFEQTQQKAAVRILPRVQLEPDAECQIWLRADGGDFVPLCRIRGEGKQLVRKPIPILRCQRFCLKFTGTGSGLIYGIDVEYEPLSDAAHTLL